MTARITLITSGHLATSPRMLKAADALADAGYRVRVVSTRSIDWAAEADAELWRSRVGRWEWSVVDHRRDRARFRWLATGARVRLARLLSTPWSATGPAGAPRSTRRAGRRAVPGRGHEGRVGRLGAPLAVAARAVGRVHPELVAAALASPADLFYGGTTGGLAAVHAAAKRARVPYALDLEDFHSAEGEETPAARLAHALVARIEAAVLPDAAFATVSSEAIASAYLAAHAARPIARGRALISLHNVFPLPARPPSFEPRASNRLSLYWFSQTIGSGRGLEDAVRAMGLAAIRGELHLRGRAIPPYLESLRRLAREAAPALAIVLHDPAAPDRMVELCAPHDAGLSLEQPAVPNRDLCLTNKAFTYMLAGLPVVLSATAGQQALGVDLDEGALVYAPGDVATLAKGLRRWADDRASMARARRASWEAARRRWHWEHPLERGVLLDAVAGALAAGAPPEVRDAHRDHR